MAHSSFLEPAEEQKPAMTDEGCQTLGLDDDNAAEALADLSRQQGTAVGNSTLLLDRSGILEVSAPGLTEDLTRSEAPIDIRPPPIPHVVLQDEIQEESTEQQASSPNEERVWRPAHIDAIPSDTISLVHPVERSDSVTDETVHPIYTVEVEDLYGLSPTVDGYPRSANAEADFGQTASDHDASHLVTDNDYYKTQHPFGDHQTANAYPKLRSRSTSPDKSFGSTLQVYPEPDIAANHDFTAHSGPYYGELHSYPQIDGEHFSQPSEGQWDMHTENVRSPNMISIAEQEMSHEVPIQKLLARHLSPGGVAMSRSQSGHSEMIDLTEDSDEEEAGLAKGSQTDDEEEKNEQFHRIERVDDQSDDEEGGYETILYDRASSESGSDELDYDNENNMRHPPGFHRVKHLAPGEVADDDDGEEVDSEGYEIEEEELEEEEIDEEDSYADEEASDDEDASTAIDQSLRGEPEVIDLLSSDEDDGEEDDASGESSERGENAAEGQNETNSTFVEEEESDFEAESDVENAEEDVMEDGHAEADLVKEATTMEDSEGLVDRSASEDDEVEDADKMERHAKNPDLPSKAMDATESFQDIQFDTRKRKSTTQILLNSYGGQDGASDNLDHFLVAPREGEEEGTAANLDGNEVEISGEVTYPVLPIVEEDQPLHQKISTQPEDALVMSKNDQLPTPDATQVSAAMPPNTSFGSIGSFQPSLNRIDSMKDSIMDTQDSPQQELMEGIEEVRVQASVSRFATEAPKDAARDAFVDAAADAVEESTESIAAIEAVHASEQATMDTSTDGARDIITRKAPNATSSVAEELVKDAIIEAIEPTPMTPRRSKRLSFSKQHKEMAERSPSITMDEPTTPDDYDASVELAMAALDSPSKQESDEQHVSDRQLRVMLSRPLRTDLGDFTTLKLIRFNLEKKLDILAIVTTLPSEPQRAKAGLRHYHLRFNVTDATIAPSGVVSVNIFRPYKTALPSVHPGEVVLLRTFLVKSEKGAGFALRSDEGSSWVVFKHGGKEEVKGPPVEYGDGERDHVAYLKAWYRNLDSNCRERLEKANVDKGSEVGRSVIKAF